MKERRAALALMNDARVARLQFPFVILIIEKGDINLRGSQRMLTAATRLEAGMIIVAASVLEGEWAAAGDSGSGVIGACRPG